MARKKKSGKPRIVARAELPTRYGRFTILGIDGSKSAESAVALVHGKIRRGDAPLVRIHSQCLTGDVFHSERCDCRAQLEMALERTSRARCAFPRTVHQAKAPMEPWRWCTENFALGTRRWCAFIRNV